MANAAPSSVPIQVESIETGGPTSESMLGAIAGVCNFMLLNKPAVGDVMLSALDEATFQSQRSVDWVLADGRAVPGSAYVTLTSQTNIPDFRGVFPRGKDNGRGINPNGNLAIGAQTTDQFAAHAHTFALTQNNANVSAGPPALGGNTGGNNATESTTSVGGTETAPKSVTINFFIKIN